MSPGGVSGDRTRGGEAKRGGTMAAQTEPIRSPAPLQQMLQLLNGHCVEQALHVAAVLGIADLLADGAKGVDELASATGAHGPSLYRVLRMLAGIGVFDEGTNGRFTLTPLGATLRSDVPDSVRDRAIFYGSPEMWRTWGNLRHAVMTGESPFEHTHGEPFYEYLARHPGVGAPFNRYMTKSSEQHNPAIVASYDFSSIGTLVDVGGGHGATLAAILQRHPALRGILYDLPPVVGQASRLEAAGLAGRCTVIGGDMLEGVPGGGDAYLIKWVLMDRPDDVAVRLLGNCAAAMGDDGKVLVVEMVMPPGGGPSFSKVMDVQMLLVFGGGRLRTEAEFRDLFAAAGLRLTRVTPTASPNSIIEGVRA
jgi:hypothetical protein